MRGRGGAGAASGTAPSAAGESTFPPEDERVELSAQLQLQLSAKMIAETSAKIVPLKTCNLPSLIHDDECPLKKGINRHLDQLETF